MLGLRKDVTALLALSTALLAATGALGFMLASQVAQPGTPLHFVVGSAPMFASFLVILELVRHIATGWVQHHASESVRRGTAMPELADVVQALTFNVAKALWYGGLLAVMGISLTGGIVFAVKHGAVSSMQALGLWGVGSVALGYPVLSLTRHASRQATQAKELASSKNQPLAS